MLSDFGEKVKKKMLKFMDRWRDRYMDVGYKWLVKFIIVFSLGEFK